MRRATKRLKPFNVTTQAPSRAPAHVHYWHLTSQRPSLMSAFGVKADILKCSGNVRLMTQSGHRAHQSRHKCKTPVHRLPQRSTMMSSRGCEQQISTLPSAGASTGDGE